jgi:hypothetical protein
MVQLVRKVNLGIEVQRGQQDPRENMVILEALVKLVCKASVDPQADKGLWVKVGPLDLEVSLVLMARMVKLDHRESKDCLDGLDLLVTRDL